MSGFMPIVGFLAIALLFGFFGNSENGGFAGTGTSTQERSVTSSDYESREEYISEAPKPALSGREAESRVADLYRELDSLKEEVRKAQLWAPVSPYRGTVSLSRGSVWSTDPDTEYLTLHATGDAPLTITNWYLESYVTNERAAILKGDRVLERWRSPVFENIVLAPGERAYLISGDSPLDTSFHENICTGYLGETPGVGDFEPRLSRNCPSPMNELKEYGKIRLDDDTCYDFVERMSTCVVPEDEDIRDARLTGACRTFIDKRFGYNNCVVNHRTKPLFSRDGYWYIYLENREELWRSEREIIRLRDENGRIVDVLEY